MLLNGGSVTMDAVAVSDCSADNNDGGFAYIEGGSLRMSSSALSRCSAAIDGAIVFFGRYTQLFVGTYLVIKQEPGTKCTSLMARTPVATTQFILRATEIEAEPSCDSGTLFSADEQSGQRSVEAHTCSSQAYSDEMGLNTRICALNAICSDLPVTPQSNSTSVYCACDSSSYADPGNPALAPYTPGGCLVPKQMDEIVLVSPGITASLHKPDLTSKALNLTLRMKGTDSAASRWEVTNANRLHSWIELPFTSGEILPDANVIMIPVKLHSLGLPERATSYQDILNVSVSSALVSLSDTVPIRVTVTAVTAQVAWGRVPIDQTCGSVPQLTQLETSALTQRMVAFTACDMDSLPVDHAVPTPADDRHFSSTLTGSTTVPDSYQQEPSITFLGSGVYEVSVFINGHGNHSLEVLLGGTLFASLLIKSVCPKNRASLVDGTCGCLAGEYLAVSGEAFDCKPCPMGSAKEVVGNEQCAPCHPGTFTAVSGATVCASCPTTTYSAASGGTACDLCPIGFSSYPGSASCDVCAPGYFERGHKCEPCPRWAECPKLNTSLATLLLKEGYWRLAPDTERVKFCSGCTDGSGEDGTRSCTSSTCRGGNNAGTDGSGLCRDNTTGPMCTICLVDGTYFDSESNACAECPDSSSVAGQVVAIMAIFSGVVTACYLIYRQARSRSVSTKRRYARFVLGMVVALNPTAKLKIVYSFVQIVLMLPSVYRVWVCAAPSRCISLHDSCSDVHSA